MSKIALVSLGTQNIARIRDISAKTKQDYCNKNGYDFIQYKNILDPSRHPSWNKILALQNHIDDYDWLFWTDADAIIINNIKIEKTLDNDFNVLISKDGMGLNAGSFVIKCSSWSKAFLKKIYSMTQYIDNGFWEQAAIQELFKKKNYKPHFKVINKTIINSYLNDISKDSLILHLPGSYKGYISGVFKSIDEGSFVASEWKAKWYQHYLNNNKREQKPWYFGLEGSWWWGMNEEQFLEEIKKNKL